jgi:hypothetical protein
LFGVYEKSTVTLKREALFYVYNLNQSAASARWYPGNITAGTGEGVACALTSKNVVITMKGMFE